MSYNESLDPRQGLHTVSDNNGGAGGNIPAVYQGRIVQRWFSTDGDWAPTVTLPPPTYDGQMFYVLHNASNNSTIATTNTNLTVAMPLNASARGAIFIAVGPRWYRVHNT